MEVWLHGLVRRPLAGAPVSHESPAPPVRPGVWGLGPHRVPDRHVLRTCRGCRANFALPGRGAAPHTSIHPPSTLHPSPPSPFIPPPSPFPSFPFPPLPSILPPFPSSSFPSLRASLWSFVAFVFSLGTPAPILPRTGFFRLGQKNTCVETRAFGILWGVLRA